MTEMIERFQAQLVGIEPEQARQMRLAWDTEDAAPRKAAWATATAALRAAGRGGELDELREAVNGWAGDKAFNFQDLYGGGSPERTRQEARVAALPAVMDAGLAAIAADFLDVDQRYLLTKPYRTGVTGEAGRPRRPGRTMRRPAGR
jgi:hypothetical protein